MLDIEVVRHTFISSEAAGSLPEKSAESSFVRAEGMYMYCYGRLCNAYLRWIFVSFVFGLCFTQLKDVHSRSRQRDHAAKDFWEGEDSQAGLGRTRSACVAWVHFKPSTHVQEASSTFSSKSFSGLVHRAPWTKIIGKKTYPPSGVWSISCHHMRLGTFGGKLSQALLYLCAAITASG